MSDLLTNDCDCDCEELLERRAAEKGHELSVVERWAAREFNRRMTGLERLVNDMHGKVVKMETTLYDVDGGIIVRQKLTMDRLVWTKWIFSALAYVATFLIGSLATILLIRDRLSG